MHLCLYKLQFTPPETAQPSDFLSIDLDWKQLQCIAIDMLFVLSTFYK
jgi:hypothetical protein